MIRGLNMALWSQARYRLVAGAVLFFCIGSIYYTFSSTSYGPWSTYRHSQFDHGGSDMQVVVDVIANSSRHFLNEPLSASQFGELGNRVQTMRKWIETKDAKPSKFTAEQRNDLSQEIDKAVVAAFPFIKSPSTTWDENSLDRLRSSFKPGSKGIVIPTGKGTFRYACHLVSSLRDVLKSELPIQIIYAGDDDLPPDYRYMITRLGARVEALDILKILDDTTLQLATGGWAIKAFAALASTFEQVLLVDADVVFVQKPEAIFDQHADYKSTGALLFHDRLLWQGAFQDRHTWWEKEMEGHVPSATLNKSKVYNDGYAEEGDSGVVALHKGRLDVFMGLLHICWQNTHAVRESITYKICYGDKESWWFGLELSGASYAFEEHYGSMLGSIKEVNGKTKICSFTIAHLDMRGKLLWYNGSLLKNKAVNQEEFDVPTHYMVDGVWEKGASKPDISCMRDAEVREVTAEEREVLARSVEAAKKVDGEMKKLTSV